MSSDPDDKWSYGLPADPEEPDLSWPAGSGSRGGPSDTLRLSSGRWTSSGVDPLQSSSVDDGLPSASPAGPFGARGPLNDPASADADSLFWNEDGHKGYFDVPDGDVPSATEASTEHRARADGDLFGDDFGDDFDDDFDEEKELEGSDARRNAIEWAVVLVGAVLLALLLRAVLLQAFWIPSPSMESTLLVRDRVLVNKISYRLHDINRGDVVVFRRTDEEISQNADLPRDVIKRVIGLPGETIEIKDNTVMIGDDIVLESYIDEGVVTDDFGPVLIPEGHIFVMGDNRQLSLDSRFATGPVATDRVVGRAFFLFWPLNRMGSL